ncbi:MAG: glycosyltransferase family 39 protein [Flavobacteriales bacterium]
MPLTRIDRYVLITLVSLNAVLKFSWLGVNELSGDEPFTVFWAQQHAGDLFSMLRDENNPPLYFFLMKWWSACTPFEVPWLRVPSALFSVLAVWPLFLLARRHLDLWAAATACLLFTLCNEHYVYAHEVRAYSLLTLLAIMGMWQAHRIAQRSPRAVLWFTLANTLLVYTHFMGWAAIGIQLLCLVVVQDWRPALRSWLKSVALSMVLFLPYGFIFLQRVGASVSKGTWLTAPAWDEPYSMLWRWSNAPVITVAFICVIAIALWRMRLKSTALRIGLVWALAPLIALFVVSFVVPLYLDRYLIWAAPGFALLVAASLSVMAVNRNLVRGSLAMACAAMLLTFTPREGNGAQPSKVVEQWKAWDPSESGRLTVLPYWYVFTFVSSTQMELYRDPYAMDVWKTMTASGIAGYDPGVPSAQEEEQDTLVILIDAGSHNTTHGARVHQLLTTRYARIDSVEATKKVWVYRFRK